MGHGEGNETGETRSRARWELEIRGQTSEVSVMLISDLQLLIFVIDDIYDFNDLNGFNAFNDLPHNTKKVLSPSPS
jgi:hypothetical protein